MCSFVRPRRYRPFLLAALLTVGAALPLVAAGSDRREADRLVLPRDWSLGDRRGYLVETRQEKSQGGQWVGGQSAGGLLIGGRIDLEVVARRGAKTILAWRSRDFALREGPAVLRPAFASLFDAVNGLETRLRWSRTLLPEGIENLSELVPVYDEAVARMTAALSALGVTESFFREVIAPFSGPDRLESSLLQDPALFFAVVGADLPLGEPLAFEGLLDNPLGGAALASTGTIEVQGLDRETGVARIYWKEQIDAAKAREAILASYQTLFAALGQPMPEAARLPPVLVSDSAFVEIDLATGWPLRIDHQRHVQIGAQSKIEQKLFRQAQP